MGQIGSDAGGVDDIVQSELINVRASLQQKREGLFRMFRLALGSGLDGNQERSHLANATRCTENNCAG